jgi:hypothetical protein
LGALPADEADWLLDEFNTTMLIVGTFGQSISEVEGLAPWKRELLRESALASRAEQVEKQKEAEFARRSQSGARPGETWTKLY